MAESTHKLPETLIYEILTWVSADTLRACRQVCRQWLRLTRELAFTALHHRRTSYLSGYLVTTTLAKQPNHPSASTFVPFAPLPPSTPPPISLHFLPRDLHPKILSSTHRGILLCSTSGGAKDHRTHYSVVHPATRQWRRLPDPRTRFFARQAAIVAQPTGGRLRFKVLRLSDPRRGGRATFCEVFDSEAWRWRRAADLPDLVLGDGAVEAGGVVYWQILDGGAHVFAFDAVREAWKMIPVPRWGGEEEARWSKYSLSAREGKLCLLRFVEYEGGREEMEVWAMHGCMEEWWKREGVVSLQQAQGIKDLYAHHVAFKMDDGLGSKAIWYDFKSLKSTTIPIDVKCGPQPRVFKFESDLSPCSLDTRVDCSLLDL